MLASQIHQSYAVQAEADLKKFEQVFGVELQRPVTIRIYPSELEYSCLNSLALALGPDDTHSRIGTREIALIGSVINRDLTGWEPQAMNALHFELAALLGNALSDGAAPPGLLRGLGAYFEDPQGTFPGRFEQAGRPAEPDKGWPSLLEGTVQPDDKSALIEQASVVAFLIDVYGWEKFMTFLARLSEVSGYRQAGVDVYGANLPELQDRWEQYYPVYVQSRWQANVIHNYDLSQFETLIAEGAYSDAQAGLTEAMPLIQQFGEQSRLDQAAALEEQAGSGVRAGMLALEARQAILDGDYAAALSKADESLDLYHQLGDTRRVEEVEAYLTMASEVVQLRAELDEARGGGLPFFNPIRAEQIVRIGQQLAALGDAEGTREVQIALLMMGKGLRAIVTIIGFVGIGICIYLIVRRILSWGRTSRGWGDLL